MDKLNIYRPKKITCRWIKEITESISIICSNHKLIHP